MRRRYRRPMTLFIDGLQVVLGQYDVIFCDVWGVIHNGVNAFVGPCEALARWRLERGPVILVSNSPRPSADVIDQLDSLGVPRGAWSDLVTSGDATRAMLAARAPGPAHCIGPQRDSSLYEGLGLAYSAIDAAAFIVCTGPRDDELDVPDDYLGIFKKGVERGLDMICANPDRVVQRGDRLVYCAGALADVYASLGGRVLMAGKPYSPIYDLSFAKARALFPAAFQKHRVLAIGDGVQTDLAGANVQGIDALFIAAGINGDLMLESKNAADTAIIEKILSDGGVSSRFVMTDLAW
jgi:HAD superfamily hydrolase (TIGR01459 family)